MPDTKKLFEDLALLLETTIENEQSSIRRIYAEAYSEIMDRIRAIYDKYADGDGVVSNADKAAMNRLRTIGDQCARRLSIAHTEVRQMLERDCATLYGESFFRNAWAVDTSLAGYGIEGSWGLIPARAADKAAADRYSLLANSQTFRHAETRTIATVQSIFAKGIIEGQSYERVRDRLIKAIGVSKVSANAIRYNGSGVGAWAMMVTRTEMHRAFSLAQAEIEDRAKEQGLELDWVWLATLDGRTRPAHGALDGQYKDEENGGWFVPELGTYVRGPGLSGVAAFDINCRCTVMAVHPEEGLPRNRYERGREEARWKTYNQWKLEKQVISEPITAKDGVVVNHMSLHAIERLSDRKIIIGFQELADTLRNPLYIRDKIDESGRNGRKYIGKKVTVTVNPDTGNILSFRITGTREKRKYEA